MITTILLWLLVIALAWATHTRTGRLRPALTRTWKQGRRLVPQLVLGVVAARLLVALVPPNAISGYVGEGSGLTGIVGASLLGVIMPAGPAMFFPIGKILLDNGADIPQVVAFVTAWLLFSAHRMVSFELPLMGGEFVARRIAATGLLPVLAGIGASIVRRVLA